MTSRHTQSNPAMDSELHAALVTAGFYPQLVSDVLEDALAGYTVVSHMVHLETHIDNAEVHRHVTALVVTNETLVVLHVDDEMLDEQGAHVSATVSTETVPLVRLGSVILSYGYYQPQNYKTGDQLMDLTVTASWSGSQRADLVPATCGDPQCDADHGYQGTLPKEDMVLRVSVEADGAAKVDEARRFARALRAASVRATIDAASGVVAGSAVAPSVAR
ncbi:hypothetical protein HD598_002490 [Neomicrococcus aestuarii]|uniref:Cell wall biosynthesis glycosyltransferase n=1 Tax=Neomicrococcus aestuarii TaxID=556325 RepID=A0A7W8TVX0_9MICC|nr:DUF5998 family protein [Neomicrococcus aestuarii]MBB5513803.1 hypothetical protein [Neomicrococcus aestuarii]